AIYHQPFLAHATLEPMNCTLDWREDVCEIWTGTQACDRAVAKLAALGLKPEQIRLHSYLIGGGFGRRLEVDGIVLAARVARHVQGPVRVLWPREEDIQHDRYRPYYVDRLSASLDAHGMPLAWRHTIAGAGLWPPIEPAGARRCPPGAGAGCRSSSPSAATSPRSPKSA